MSYECIKIGVAESGDDFTKFSKIFQWFQTLIHLLIQQRLTINYNILPAIQAILDYSSAINATVAHQHYIVVHPQQII
ncbi:hypothetical protein RintRC_3439 [Richelia intracellularis]|nr:hypothetical protein RintRC_3439 [Richelia intracellularis]